MQTKGHRHRMRQRTGSPAATASASDTALAERRVAWPAGVAIFLAALTLRLLHVWQIRHGPLFSVLLGDARSYDAWAQQLAAGDWLGQDVFYQAPLYPYVLGVLYASFGHNLGLVRVAQALIGAATCVVITLTGARLFGRRAGIWTGVLLAVYAPAIFFDALLQKAVLDIFLLCSVLLLVTLVNERMTRRRCFWTGVALGSFALTRENGLVLLPIVGVWVWLRGKRVAAPVLALTVGIAAVLIPVGLRNLAVGGEFHLTTSQLGPNFYIGNHEGATGNVRGVAQGARQPDVRADRRNRAGTRSCRPCAHTGGGVALLARFRASVDHEQPGRVASIDGQEAPAARQCR